MKKEYCIYLTQGYYFNGELINRKLVLFDAQEARRMIIKAHTYMKDKSDFIQSVYKPAIRKVKSLNPIVFYNEALNVQTNLNMELGVQANGTIQPTLF